MTEDGVPVEVAGFAGGGEGAVTTALVVDRSSSMEDEDKIVASGVAAPDCKPLLD